MRKKLNESHEKLKVSQQLLCYL